MKTTAGRMKTGLVGAALAGMLAADPGRAATNTWDADTTTVGAQDGSGVWSTLSNTWWTGSANTTWPLGDSAIFGVSAGGTVTNIDATVGHIIFNQAYTILSNTLTLAGTPTLTANANATIGSLLAGTGFVKAGTGTLTLNPYAASAYSGLVTVDAGTLIVAGAGGDGTVRGNVTVNSGATLQINTGDRIINTAVITLNGTGRLNLNGGGDAIGFLAGDGLVTNSTTTTRTITLDLGPGVTNEFSGRIRRAVALTIRNANGGATGVQILSGDNDFTNNVTVNSGRLRIEHNNALGGTGAGTTIAGGTSNGVLQVAGNITVAEPMTLAMRQNASATVPHIQNVAGTNTLTGALTLNSGGTYWNIASDGGKLILAQGIAAGASATGGRTLRLGGEAEMEVRGVISNGSASTFNLIKFGSGTLTLSTNNTYNGTTTIEAGRLALGPDGRLTNSSAIAVSAGAVFDVASVTGGFTLQGQQSLSGAGSVTGNVASLAGARFSANTFGTAGTLTFANDLVLAAGVTNQFELSGSTLSGNDRIAVGGALTLDGVVLVNPTAGLTPGAVYRLFDYGGALTVGAPTASLLNTRYTGTLLTGTAQQVDVQVNSGGFELLWQGGAGPAWDLNATTNWNAGAEKFLIGDRVTFDDSSATQDVTLAAAMHPESVTVSSASNYTFSGAGRIGGSAGLVKDGTGMLTISNANDFTGSVTVSNGILRAANNGALGASNGVTYIRDGASLEIGGNYALSNEIVHVMGAGVGGTGAVFNATAAAQNALRYVYLDGDATFNATARFDVRGASAASRGVLEGGDYVLTKIGTNTLALPNVVVDLSKLAVEEGTVSFESGTALTIWDWSGSGGVTVAGGATLQLWNLNAALDVPITFAEGALVSAAAGDNAVSNTLIGPVTLDGTVTNLGAGRLNVAGPVGGSGGFVHTGSGTLQLRVDNTFSGTVVVAGSGAVVAASSGALGTTDQGTTVVGGSGTTGRSLNLAGNITIADEPLRLEGSAAGRAFLRNSSDTNTWTGPITLAGDVNSLGFIAEANSLLRLTGDITGTATNGSAVMIRGNGSGELLGSVMITGALFKTEDTAGTQWLVGAPGKTYQWDSLSVARGKVVLGVAGMLPPASPVYMGEGGNNSAVLDLNGYEQTIAGLQTNSGVTGAAALTNSRAPATLIISNVADFVFNKTVTDAGTGAELSVVKDGPGTQTFAGTNAYHGSTTVRAGVLVAANASALGSNSAVTSLVDGGIAFSGITAMSMGSLAGDGDLALQNLAAAAVALTVGGNDLSTGYDGVLGGAGSLTKVGSGTFTLNAAAVYAGATTNRAGTLALGAAGALPAGTGLVLGDTAVRANAGTLELAGHSQSLGRLAVVTQAAGSPPATNRVAGLEAGQALTVTTPATGDALVVGDSAHLQMSGGGALYVDAPAGNLTVWGLRTNDATKASGLDLGGLGVFTARVAQLYVGYDTGNVTRQGALVLADTNDVAAGQIHIGYSTLAGGVNGRLYLGRDNTIRTTNMFVGNGKGIGQIQAGAGGAFDLRLLGLSDNPADPDYRANLTLGRFNQSNSGTLPTGRIAVTNAGESITARLGALVLGSIETNAAGAANGGYGYFDFAAGAVDADTIVVGRSLSGAGTGTGTGALTMKGGTLEVGGGFILAQRLGGASATGTVVLAGGTATVHTNITGGGGVSSFTLDGASLELEGHELGTAAGPITSLTIRSGVLRNVGGINGGGPLVKTGAGELVLEGVNAYTGGTLVSNGVLRVNGTLTGGGLITAAAGTVAGTGTVAGLTLQSGVVLSPGNSVGTLTVSNLTLQTGVLLDYELAGTAASDRIVDLGDTVIEGLSWGDVTFTLKPGFGPGTYTLIQGAGVTSGTVDASVHTLGGYDASLSIGAGSRHLLLTVVPEPATLGLIGLGMLAALLRRRHPPAE